MLPPSDVTFTPAWTVTWSTFKTLSLAVMRMSDAEVMLSLIVTGLWACKTTAAPDSKPCAEPGTTPPTSKWPVFRR